MKSIIRSQTSQYKLVYDLGRGQQGSVFCAENTQNGEHYAVKTINMDQITSKEAMEK
jgi:serine/threonine protein kinase